MDGRRWLCIALLAIAPGCSDAIDAVGDVGRTATREKAIEERPSLREIFRNGAYTFEAANPELRRWVQRRLAANATVRESLDKLSVKVVRTKTGPIVVMAMVLADMVEGSAAWDGFIRAASESAGADVDEGELDDVKTAYMEVRQGRTLALYYAPDLIVTAEALPKTPRGDLEELASYLLEAR